VTVVLTRVADGKTWTFTKNDANKSGKYFNISNAYFGAAGLSYCIIFRPDGIGSYSGAYNVSVLGLKYLDGKTAPFDYTVEFFDIDDVDSGDSNSGGGAGEGGGGCNVATPLALILLPLLLKRRQK
jgi:hypothetical protein